MARYKIATKTDKLRYQIAKEVFGEIEDSDGVRDIPSWEIFEKCLEQHKRIIELEAENDLVRNTKINTNKMECIHLQAETQEIQDQLALTEKALELAVADKIKYENLMVEGIVGKGAKMLVPKKEQWYLEQAQKEMMKSE